jgi:biopolymer transport protein ExbD
MKGLTEQMEMECGDQADLTPMIDCVFLLLLFFIVTTSFSEETYLFEIELPKAEKSSAVTFEDSVQVVIEKGGKYSVGNETFGEKQLWKVLSQQYKKEHVPLVVRGDAASPYQKVISVMDMAQELGVKEISWAVNPPEINP